MIVQDADDNYLSSTLQIEFGQEPLATFDVKCLVKFYSTKLEWDATYELVHLEISFY